jgi:phosphatidate cytidylyltransferase
MLKTRVLSAAVLLPIVLGAIWFGGWAFAALMTMLLLIAAREVVQMFSSQGMVLAIGTILGHMLLWLAYGRWEESLILEIGLPFITLVSVAEHVITYRHVQSSAERWALSIAGGTYLGIGGAHLLRLRWLQDGRWWLLLTLLIVWVADSGAYFAGRAWGKHKMAPGISPNKSWEGYVVGIACGGLIGVLGGALWPESAGDGAELTLWQGAILGGMLAALTPLGDFFVSSLKRQVGVKDTSSLIPGHGGVLDRLDSPLWAGVLAWMFITLIVK